MKLIEPIPSRYNKSVEVHRCRENELVIHGYLDSFQCYKVGLHLLSVTKETTFYELPFD